MSQTPRITHVIYDLDGTLLDTEPMFIETTNAIFGRFGRTLPSEVRALMIGRPTKVAVPLMLEHTQLPITADEFIHEREVLLEEKFRAALPMLGARELTDHLGIHGIPQAIGTSSSRQTLHIKMLGHPEWFDGFGAVVCADDVEHGKPAPDIFLEAARRIRGRPEQCLVFEDAPSGVEAALAAGMHVIAIPEPGYEDLVRDAHAVIPSLAHFDPAAWGLPPRRPVEVER